MGLPSLQLCLGFDATSPCDRSLRKIFALAQRMWPWASYAMDSLKTVQLFQLCRAWHNFFLLFPKGTSAGQLYRKFSSLGPRFLGTTKSLFALKSLKLTSRRAEVLSLGPGVDSRQFIAKQIHLEPCLKLWRQLVSMLLDLAGWEPVECGWLWNILIESLCLQQVISGGISAFVHGGNKP